MEPQLTCPTGHRLENRMCVTEPMMTCPAGFNLMNNMCVASNTATVAGIEVNATSPSPVSRDQQEQVMKPEQEQTTTSGTEPISRITSTITTNTCPEGYVFSSSDNMCYPLKN